MSDGEEQKQGVLTLDLLKRISKKAISLKGLIEADRVRPNEIHNSVLNSITQIFQIIREDMTEHDFNTAVGASANKMQAAYQTSDIGVVRRNLARMA